ncbi:MAG TPA: glucose-1-phosphate cytidylyltransferase [Myxococcaceae bacterium]|nr:glucose-1-phosphate cytidylyltransferase [Myxococcaceae bacterium]
MKVVLFCGGLGTRLRELTGEIPKPMVKIGYRPILWHLMKYYAHFGHKDFILCLGYKADVIKQFFLEYEEWISNDFTLSRGGKDLRLERSDIEDWNITFVDTGLHANIGQRLMAVRKYVEDDEIFLANYSDGLTDLDLDKMVRTFRESRHVASFLAVQPSQSFHLVTMAGDGLVSSIRSVKDSDLLINGGFFVLRREIFDYMRPGDELVLAPFERLIAERKLLGYRCERFWCMDTFKEQQELTDLYNSGRAPWEVWKSAPSRLASAG